MESFRPMRKKRKDQRHRSGRKRSPVAENREVIDPRVPIQFDKYVDKHLHKLIRDRVMAFKGKNYVENYQDHYQFEEEWQEKVSDDNLSWDFGISSSNMYEAMSLLLYLVFIGCFFISTVDYFFKVTGPRDFYSAIYSIAILALVADAGFHVYTKMTSQSSVYYRTAEIVQDVYIHLLQIMFLGFKIADMPERRQYAWAALEIANGIVLLYRTRKIERTFRFLRFLLNIEYEAKIIDLLVSLIIILHNIAIVLICTTYLFPNQNWLMAVTNIDTHNEFVVYLRAFYFATTTVLTVGYGDISPRNDLEVGVVTMVELSGIIIFAYLINEIGYCMSQLRKETEIVDKDLSSVQKIKRQYKMTEENANRLRSFVINQKPTQKLLEPEAQQALMYKLNEDLRNDVQKENHLSIIKTSLFYLLRWSKDFQQFVASRLTHILFSPNELIYQPADKERVYIFRVGTVNIYAQRNRNRRCLKNILKVITAEVGVQNFDNTYGWTAAMSKRPCRMYAYSKDYASAYYIDKAEFRQGIKDASTDFEYYHEIKNKLDEAKCCEALELPVLDSSRKHYNPSRFVVLRRNKDSPGQLQSRVDILRRATKSKKKCILKTHEQAERAKQTLISIKSDNYISLREIEEESKPAYEPSLKLSESHDRDESLSLKELTGTSLNEQPIDPILHVFEESREYSNYFHRHNISKVLLSLDRCCSNHSVTFENQVIQSYHNLTSKTTALIESALDND